MFLPSEIKRASNERHEHMTPVEHLRRWLTVPYRMRGIWETEKC